MIRWSIRQLLGSIRGRRCLKFSFSDVNKGLQVEFIAFDPCTLTCTWEQTPGLLFLWNERYVWVRYMHMGSSVKCEWRAMGQIERGFWHIRKGILVQRVEGWFGFVKDDHHWSDVLQALQNYEIFLYVWWELWCTKLDAAGLTHDPYLSSV